MEQEGNGRIKELFEEFRQDLEEGQASHKIKDQSIAHLHREVEALTKERERLTKPLGKKPDDQAALLYDAKSLLRAAKGLTNAPMLAFERLSGVCESRIRYLESRD